MMMRSNEEMKSEALALRSSAIQVRSLYKWEVSTDMPKWFQEKCGNILVQSTVSKADTGSDRRPIQASMDK